MCGARWDPSRISEAELLLSHQGTNYSEWKGARDKDTPTGIIKGKNRSWQMLMAACITHCNTHNCISESEAMLPTSTVTISDDMCATARMHPIPNRCCLLHWVDVSVEATPKKSATTKASKWIRNCVCVCVHSSGNAKWETKDGARANEAFALRALEDEPKCIRRRRMHTSSSCTDRAQRKRMWLVNGLIAFAVTGGCTRSSNGKRTLASMACSRNEHSLP